jgi:hypothetical protein
MATQRPAGLDKVERILFVFGVLAFGFLLLVFGQPLVGSVNLALVVGLWIVVGLGFIWGFDRYLASRDERKVARLDEHRRRRARR